MQSKYQFSDDKVISQNLTEEDLNDYFGQICAQKSSQMDQFETHSEIQPIIYNTLQLEYRIGMVEEELKFYKLKLGEKEAEIKRFKEKINKKNIRLNSLSDSIQKCEKKTKQICQGYKKMEITKCEMMDNEKRQREERLSRQTQKNDLYKQYSTLQEEHRSLVDEIEPLSDVDIQYQEALKESQAVLAEIERLEEKRRNLSEKDQAPKKQQLRMQLKKLFERIRQLEIQDQNICEEYQKSKRALTELQREESVFQNKNIQVSSLFEKKQRLKDDIQAKSAERNQTERQFYELLKEEERLKKQINLEMEYRQNQVKIKDSYPHKFRVIDSEGDEQLHKMMQANEGNYDLRKETSIDSQDQLDDLINRFQKIKTKKSKNG